MEYSNQYPKVSPPLSSKPFESFIPKKNEGNNTSESELDEMKRTNEYLKKKSQILEQRLNKEMDSNSRLRRETEYLKNGAARMTFENSPLSSKPFEPFSPKRNEDNIYDMGCVEMKKSIECLKKKSEILDQRLDKDLNFRLRRETDCLKNQVGQMLSEHPLVSTEPFGFYNATRNERSPSELELYEMQRDIEALKKKSEIHEQRLNRKIQSTSRLYREIECLKNQVAQRSSENARIQELMNKNCIVNSRGERNVPVISHMEMFSRPTKIFHTPLEELLNL